jgi:hypothetical protein
MQKLLSHIYLIFNIFNTIKNIVIAKFLKTIKTEMRRKAN